MTVCDHLFSPLYGSCLPLFLLSLQFPQTQRLIAFAHPRWTCYTCKAVPTRWHSFPPVWLGWCHITQPGVCASLGLRVIRAPLTTTGYPPFENSMNRLICCLVPLVVLHFLWLVSGVSHSLSELSALFIIQNQMYCCHMWDYWCCYLMTVRISGIYLWSMVYVKSSYWETCTIFTVWFDFSVPGKMLS